MPKKNPPKRPKVHEELRGFAIRINEFGEIETTFEIDKVNTFLNENVDDKKFRDSKGDDTEETGHEPE